MALHLLGFLQPFPIPCSLRNPFPVAVGPSSSPSLPLHVFPSGAHQWFFSAKPLHCAASPVAAVEREEEKKSAEGNRTRVIAQNIPWTATADDVRCLFQKYGSVDDVELSMHNSTRNRGLAFVTMGSEKEAMEAINGLNMQEIDGRTIKVEFARSLKKKPSVRPEPVKRHNVFVGNLNWRTRSRDLREFFTAFNPNVLSVELIFRTNPRRTAGYGFASFATKEEAEAAIAALDGKEIQGRPVRLVMGKGLKQALNEVAKSEQEADEVSDTETMSEVNDNMKSPSVEA